MMETQYKSIYSLIKAQAERNPKATALLAPNRSPMSYGLLKDHVENVGKELNSMGLGRHDRIAIVLPNGAEMATSFITIASVATCAPLNPAYGYNEFDFYLTDLDAKALIIQAGMESQAIDVAKEKGIPIIELSPTIDAEAGLFALKGDTQFQHSDREFAEPDDLALVLHTSGTTSRPKIVPLKHYNVCMSASNIRETLNLAESDRCLNIMPLFHIHGLVGALLSSLASGASIALTSGFDAPNFLDLVAEFQPTWYTAVPTMHMAILARAKSNPKAVSQHPFRFIRSCSSALPKKVMRELEETFNVPAVEAYGMTEASHQISCNPLPPALRKGGSVGLATGTEIAILDELGNILPSGDKGEIALKGESVIKGYENNPSANETSFTNGWFRTGDQGYLDDDNYLFITGRIKEIINRGGEKISPQEIDDVLIQHPAIAQVITFAIPHIQLGEEIASAVVLRGVGGPSENRIRQFVAAHLADFKVPRRIMFVDEIPKGPTGKLQRIGMAERLGMIVPNDDADSETEYVPPRNGLEKKLAAIWSKILRINQVGIHDNFFYLGGDSLLAAQVIARIRSEMKKSISLMDFLDNPTIANIAEIVKTRGENAKKFSVLVNMKTGDSSLNPVFCIHSCTGNVMVYNNLLRHLDQPIYGLKMQGLYGEKRPHSRLVDMASHYVKEIKSVQPKGPYYIVGVRDSAWIATEMAQQLLQQGDDIGSLLMIDARYFDLPIGKRASNVQVANGNAQQNPVAQNATSSSRMRHYIDRSLHYMKQGQFIQVISGKIVNKLRGIYGRERTKCYWRFAYSWLSRHLEYINRRIDYGEYMRHKYAAALFSHVPRNYTGKATLFVPEKSPDSISTDRWKEAIDGELEIVAIEGGHYSIWMEPNVQAMAKKLKPYLDNGH